jgi:hypothetical protein
VKEEEDDEDDDEEDEGSKPSLPMGKDEEDREDGEAEEAGRATADLKFRGRTVRLGTLPRKCEEVLGFFALEEECHFCED